LVSYFPGPINSSGFEFVVSETFGWILNPFFVSYFDVKQNPWVSIF
jgi:hypothetical protein